VHWHSFELRPKGSPPIPDWYRARITESRPRLEAMAREKYGLELRQGPFGIDSRPALIGAKYAEAQGVGDAYHDAAFRAYWQQAQDISDLHVLREIAKAVRLSIPTFLTALNDQQYDQQVTEDVERANAYGLNGVPALIFGDKYLVSGAQPYEFLAQVVEKIQEENAT
jgi:predicted DsbA family dithiol-disulfide isomerase